jgi:signal transduction histidine kinase
VEVSTRVVLKNGEPQGIQGIARDISDRRKAEEERQRFAAQLQHAQKLEGLGVLAGGIAHDFNNLLVGVLGYAGLALVKLPEESPARNYVERIEATARRAAELTNQMLAYSGRGTFMIKPLNLNKLTEEMVRLLDASISKKVTLRFNHQPNLPMIKGDAAQLHQVVMNLITNASDAIGEEVGMITLSTYYVFADRAYLSSTYLDDDLPPGEYVCMEVSDTGCGMDAATSARIFDPFFSTKFAGRGLGLAATLGIIRGHRGAIKVYSEPGHGTTFKVLLPVAEEDATMPKPEAEDRSVELWTSTGTILIADDEETAREVAKEACKNHGFDVITANNGKEAVEIFKEKRKEISAIILDLMMPVMNGQEAFIKIKGIQPTIPIILSSGYTEEDATTRIGGINPNAFVQKTYSLNELSRKLKGVIQ